MKNNSHKQFKKIIDEVKGLERKPTLLLHTCCAPCASYPILLLNKYFKLTIYYGNSNIFPKEEFIKRLEETKRYIDLLNKDLNEKIKLVIPPYRNEKYNEILKRYKDEKEGGTRCSVCYSLRFKELAEYAKEHNYEYICSTMTISRHKKEVVLNKIISSFAQKNKIKPLVSNFKKEKGLEISQRISKDNKMYHQNYCGCKFSLNKLNED